MFRAPGQGIFSRARRSRETRDRTFNVLAFFLLSSFFYSSMALAARPKIWGTPTTEAVVGERWRFRPHASDADGDRLYFWVKNRPSWAWFNWRTGNVSGIPGRDDVGVIRNITLGVSDSRDRKRIVWMKPFDLKIRRAGSADSPETGNQRPLISGTPPTTAVVGQRYSFTPTARDPDGDALFFWIRNRPSWATIDRSTGRLYGTPSRAHVGTYADIVIAASDGSRHAPLDPFTINVMPSAGVPSATGSATLSWLPPTTRIDGSPLNNLAGYRILWGTSQGNYSSSVRLANAGLTRYVVENLAPATYYFAIVAFDSNGLQSRPSNAVRKTISN